MVRLREIVGQAAELTDPAERDAYLDRACGGDSALRAEARSLLEALDGAGRFMQPPTLDTGTGAPTGASAGAASADGLVPTARPRRSLHRQSPTERPGAVIGRYKLLQQIGEGGFGVVYMAEQEKPVRRRVALKIIKAGMDTRAVIARFEAERQALAMMDHPNIARVLDAGATDAGRPYFVMELVKGIPITDYCDEANLDPPQRLALFMDVCSAVQHAHQKGVIHRDLKPSNIMVTLHDSRPVVKVIDFGIAKATGQKLTEKTLFTQYGQMIGTPTYMSPEQAVMSGLDVDTRSDVYSLGVLLYELLTGGPPFDADTLRSAGFDEMRRMIREVEPPRPSTRISTLAQDLGMSVAARRHATPATLSRLLHGDLDWIIMKALEKDRGRRYESASALAADVLRHLEHEPVSAGPPGLRYRVSKFVRRNRAAVVVAACVAGSLLAGIVVSSAMYLRAEDARADAVVARNDAQDLQKQAEANEARALAEAAKARQIADLMKRLIGASAPGESEGPTYTVRQLLDDISREMDLEMPEQPEVAAAMHLALGNAYGKLALHEEARTHFAVAVRTVEAMPQQDELTLASALIGLADEHARTGRTYEARIAAERAVRIQEARYGPNDPRLAEGLKTLADVLKARSEGAEADRLYQRAAAIAPAPVKRRITHNQAALLLDRGRYDEAETAFRQVIEEAQRTDDARVLHFAKLNLANLCARTQRFGEAVALLREVVRDSEQRNGPTDMRTIEAETELAKVQFGSGDASAGLASINKVWGRVKDEPLLDDVDDVTSLLADAVRVVYGNQQYHEAEAMARWALERRLRQSPRNETDVNSCRYWLGRALCGLGRHEEALPLLRQSEAFWNAAAAGAAQNEAVNYELQYAKAMVGVALVGAGRLDEAEPLLSASAAYVESGDAHIADLSQVLQAVARIHEARGRTREAAGALHRLAIAKARLGQWEEAQTHFATATEKDGDPALRRRIAILLAEEGRWADAIPHFEWLVEHQGDDHFHTYRLGFLYLMENDITGYRRICRVMLERYVGYTEPYVPERTAKLIAASEVGLTDELRQRALDLATRTEQSGAEDVNLDWYRLAAAIACLRGGEPERALAYLEPAAGTTSPVLLPNIGAAFALTHARLGNADAARAWLGEAQTAMDAMGRPGELKNTNWWQDWITAHLWIREAEALLAQQQQPPSQP